MELQTLEDKYNSFLNSKAYQQSGINPQYFKRNADLSRLAIIADHMVCNILFFKNYFQLAQPDHTQMASNYVILVNDIEVTLNINKAPDFRDKDEYLKWLHSQINIHG
ncbi:hypothetical protein [Acinetobacter larvae]|uniref:Uncharacterized protein n=1 Tax=Acinetobacter larvae TaxID=1789224 RepID=A0A1B2M0S6_9GAMM|nr:hypothetical protein [Acinetobacter larvae]AOA58790.1 hypothetical protein BFG52_10810 [Acinetobacter larvae]